MAIENDLKTVAHFLVTELTTELVKKKKKASGGLVRSFNSGVFATGYGYEIAVFAATYFKFVDQGVNGWNKQRGSKYSYKKKSRGGGSGGSSEFIKALMDWVQIKGIATGNKAVLGAAIAIRSKIWKNGTKGINILEEVLKSSSEQYLDKISASMITQMSFKIDNIIKNGNLNR